MVRWSTERVDIQQIRYFLAVADELHFGRAAESLHVTPSPLSRRIRDLENELGCDLFVREYHHIELTRFGRDFLEPARDVVRRFDDLKRLSRGPEALTLQHCRIGAAPLAAPQALDAVLDAFQKAAPDIELPIVLAPSAELHPKLANGSIDLAVVHLPAGVPDVEALTLVRSSYGVVMRGDDELAHRSSLTLRDLTHRQMLRTSSKVHPSFMDAVHRALVDAGITRITELPHNDAIQIAAHVQRTGALSLTLGGRNHPTARVYSEPDFAVVPLDEPGLVVEVGLAWRLGAPSRVPGLDAVLRVLREE